MSREKAMSEGFLECPEFDLRMTLESGQTFHWRSHEGGFLGCIGTIPLFLKQDGNLLHYRGGEASDLPSLLRHYFAFDHNLEAIRGSCAAHPPSRAAMLACRGLRIMRQPVWECIASFILSPMKQVAHIRMMSLALRRAYGKELSGTSIPAFPEPAVLAGASEEELRRCGLGFRARSLLSTAQLVAEGRFDPEAVAALCTRDARDALRSLPGVGRKVANCILLFAYERLEAVPVDVWIARILSSFESPKNRRATQEQLERYGERLLGPYAGYVQQCLFHQARTGHLKFPKKHDQKKKPVPVVNAKSGPGRHPRRKPVAA